MRAAVDSVQRELELISKRLEKLRLLDSILANVAVLECVVNHIVSEGGKVARNVTL